MFGKGIRLFNLLGFEVKLDLSWVILGLLITWSLAKGLFPFYYSDLSQATYWWMGIAGAFGLFFSIVFHEFFHSIVARRFGLPMKGITLFIFGGVAEMDEEPPSPKAEFFLAIAGPLSSVFIGLLFNGVSALGKSTGWPVPVTGVLGYLGFINLLLAGFNMVPAYPLDGGRVLRSALWRWKKKLRWATQISSRIGSAFGMILIFLGVLSVFAGNLIGGIWWFLIGMFLRNASQMSYQQLLTRKALEGEKVERFMNRNPVTVSSSISVKELVEDYFYKFHYKMFPVVDDGKLTGCIATKDINRISRDEWSRRTVGEIADKCTEENTIDPEEDAMRALSAMNRTENSRLMVVKEGRLAGIITLKDVMRFLSVKIDLEESD